MKTVRLVLAASEDLREDVQRLEDFIGRLDDNSNGAARPLSSGDPRVPFVRPPCPACIPFASITADVGPR
jgi:hypothetical protein